MDNKQIRKGFIIGEMLYGFCGGYFGRDSYKNKRVEAFGVDWLVCRDEDGNIHFAQLDNFKEQDNDFWEEVERWREEEKEDV